MRVIADQRTLMDPADAIPLRDGTRAMRYHHDDGFRELLTYDAVKAHLKIMVKVGRGLVQYEKGWVSQHGSS